VIASRFTNANVNYVTITFNTDVSSGKDNYRDWNRDWNWNPRDELSLLFHSPAQTL